MEQFSFGRWRLAVDPRATRDAYSAIPRAAPEACDCPPCRNFVAAKGRVYPAGVLDLFERLGIVPVREAEVYHLAPLAPGLHLYGGFLHFVGAIESGEDALTSSGAIALEPVSDGFLLGFTARVSLVHDAFRGRPLVQLEFTARVPWVLSEPEPAR
jgi:hypothetical protein